MIRQLFRRAGFYIGRVLVLGAAFSAVPAPAHAQKVLIQQGDATLYDLATGRVDWHQPSLHIGPSVVFTADGRYVVALSFAAATPAVRVMDATTGSSFDVPVSFEPRIAHPRAIVVYGLTGGALSFGSMLRGTLARLDLAGLHEYGGCPPGTTSAVDLSGDGQLLFARCDSGDVVVLVADSGVVLRTLPIGPGVTFAANFDGTALLVARPTDGGALELLDATTLAILSSTTVPGPTLCTPSVAKVSPDRTTAIVLCLIPGAPLPYTFSQVLSLPALTWGPVLSGSNLRIASVSPDNGSVYAAYVHRTAAFGNVQVNDLTSGAIAMTVPIVAQIAVSHPPLAPSLSAVVNGRRVDLSLAVPAASPAVTGQSLEIGSAPGLGDLGAIAVGTQSTVTVSSVPPGRYYVRARARNASGQSAPSSEIVVDVP